MKGIGATGVTAMLAGCGGMGDEDNRNNTVDAEEDIETNEEALQMIQELAWITNQELPMLPVTEKTSQSFQSTDGWDVPDTDSNDLYYYWPTEWVPRFGNWRATGDDDTLSVTQWDVPDDCQYNPWNTRGDAEPRRNLFDRFMSFNIVTGEYEGYAVSDWEYDGQTIDLTVRDGLTWHDGDDVVAQDIVNQIKLDMYAGSTLGDLVSNIPTDVEVVDDATARITFEGEINERIVLGYLQPTRLIAKNSEYGEYVEQFDDAENEDEEIAVLSDLQEWSVPEPIGSGPFAFEDADTQRTLLAKFDDHPDADNINFDYLEHRYMPSNERRWNALQNGELDGEATLFMPQNQVNQLPDDMQVAHVPRHWGMGLMFNHDDEHIGKLQVRQAIAHVVDRELVAGNADSGTGTKLGVSYPSGITGDFSNRVEEEWLDGVVDQFNEYETDTGRAEELLQDAGYTKEGGTWVDETGSELTVPIKVPQGFSDWVTAVQTVVDQLDEFGIAAETLTRDDGTYWGQDVPESDFVIATEGWANYDQTYPYYHFDHLYGGGDGSVQDNANFPDEFDVEVLHDDVRDSSTVDPTTIIESLAKVTSE
ncbi:ABC transporter substrate-binding protein (plasmid) [Natrinema versiforme]|uniref:ABC transporter substrate-binding protein n=2 Tax=Natrinema versiforme TaxID=88724 RepID=A0A4P8WNA2_9EURY|nr:ABC transporter substrate-binding protein [Natrinema versiforme]